MPPVKKPLSLDAFSMGSEGCGGLSIGLRPKAVSLKAGSVLTYDLAIANHTATERKVVLFNDTEGTYRTRVVVEASGRKPVTLGLVMPRIHTLGGFKIAIEIAPGAVHVSEGGFTLPAGYAGVLKLTPVLGGTPAMECELRGKSVSVTAG